MALVITNGTYYVHCTDTGRIKKTINIEEATIYGALRFAIGDMRMAPAKTSGYYIYDTDTEQICWERISDEEKAELIKQGKINKKKFRRKQYSESTRKMIYDAADGRCQLCGRKIKYSDMTLDHIIPIAMNGEDSVRNLQCACKQCNERKSSYLPDEYFDRISNTFMFQMEKKYTKLFRWKMAKAFLTWIL